MITSIIKLLLIIIIIIIGPNNNIYNKRIKKIITILMVTVKYKLC